MIILLICYKQNGGNLGEVAHRHEAADGLAELLSNRAKLRQAQTQDGRKSRWQDFLCFSADCRLLTAITVEVCRWIVSILRDFFGRDR